jgi:dipeptidase E
MSDKPRQIIAIGGGGFYRNSENLALEKYIIHQAGSAEPKVAFVPTASAEPDNYLVSFYTAFLKLGCRPSHLSFFKRTPDLRSYLLSQDVIYVGGGNTKSMLAVWREWGVPEILREAWESGIVLAGISAGAICWFEQGLTDSWADRLRPLDCLGFLPGSCCSHYDSEPKRRPSYHQLLVNGSALGSQSKTGRAFITRTRSCIASWQPKLVLGLTASETCTVRSRKCLCRWNTWCDPNSELIESLSGYIQKSEIRRNS